MPISSQQKNFTPSSLLMCLPLNFTLDKDNSFIAKQLKASKSMAKATAFTFVKFVGNATVAVVCIVSNPVLPQSLMPYDKPVNCSVTVAGNANIKVGARLYFAKG